MWQDITLPELNELLTNELTELDDHALAVWKRYEVTPVKVPCMCSDAGSETIFILARSGNQVLVYDDAHEDFGIGVLDESGVLRECSLYGEKLAWCLREFPGKHR